MQEFIVNEFIKLQLDGSETRIFVNDKHFHACKYLLLSIPVKETQDWDQYETMDEVIKATSRSRGGGEQRAELAPEEAFKGHCSNIQAWVENGYDIKILDSKLAIPIIKDILIDLLNSHNKEKSFVYPKGFWKQKFRRFFFQVVEALDDYMDRSLKNQYTHGKFSFLYKVLFRTKDIFFEPEEISGSVALSEMYAHFLPQKLKEDMIRKRSYWERKLWKRTPVVKKEFGYFVGDKMFYTEREAEKYSKAKNLEYRRFLRTIRDATDEASRYYITKSHRSGYLPYLYSTGKFTNENNISFLQIDGQIYIRDSNGYYWTEKGNEWEGF